MLPPFALSSVVYASLFGLMALGLTLTYITTKVPNFSYGSLVTVGAYTAYTLFRLRGLNPYQSIPITFIMAGSYRWRFTCWCSGPWPEEEPPFSRS